MSIRYNEMTRMYYWTTQDQCGQDIFVTEEQLRYGRVGPGWPPPPWMVRDDRRMTYYQPAACLVHLEGCQLAQDRADFIESLRQMVRPLVLGEGQLQRIAELMRRRHEGEEAIRRAGYAAWYRGRNNSDRQQQILSQIQHDPDYLAARQRDIQEEQQLARVIQEARDQPRVVVSQEPLMYEPLHNHQHDTSFDKGHWICFICQGHMCVADDGGCLDTIDKDELQRKAHP